MIETTKGSETGWPVWVVMHRDELRPVLHQGTIECWLKDTRFGDAAHSDFWRATPDGRAFLLRGYQEDTFEGIEPGTAFELTLPIWRVGECLLHAARMARELDGTRVELSMKWKGLQGRHLTTRASEHHFVGGHFVCRQRSATTTVEVEVATVEDLLSELVRELVEPLFAAFDFYEPPPQLYARELARLTGRA